jgi:hypothetical protein
MPYGSDAVITALLVLDSCDHGIFQRHHMQEEQGTFFDKESFR